MIMRICIDSARAPRAAVRGFSLVEMLVALTVLALVIGALTTVLMHASFSRIGAKNRFESMQTARSALDLVARDLRSAGYGSDGTNLAGAQPAIAYVDSMQILVCENLSPWPDTASTAGAPQAYDPAGLPKPYPLVNTTYTPSVKYTTGAELVRWTLDLNDDGLVNADDVASAEGADARRSRNPSDYTLVRQVYGAGSGGVATNNGGSTERIALVLKPGGAVAPMFSVYLNGSATPWDWSWGPVPAASLASITRVVVKISAPSGRTDSRGTYLTTLLETAVGSMRNTPRFGSTVYTVDGWVYADANFSRARDSNESGLQGAVVQIGTGRVTYTSAAGYFSFQVPAGTYTLKHTPPSGYGSYSNPDSFTLNVATSDTRSFADTTRTGGWISVHVWSDDNGNGVQDTGEAGLAAVTLTLTPGGQVASTNGSGDAQLFAQSGGWSVGATPLANYTVTTTNPVTGTMTSGASSSIAYGMMPASNGTVTGTVYNDTNSNGTKDGGESGIAGVTVTAYDGGTTGAPLPGLLGGVVAGTAVTNSGGFFSLVLPAKSGLLDKLYTLSCAEQAGRHPTTSLAYSAVTLVANQTSAGRDFGFGTFSTLSLTCGAVSSLAVSDLFEGDGSDFLHSAADKDLVVGHTDGLGNHIAYWLNAYPSSPFAAAASYSYAPNRQITALATDSTWISTMNPRTPNVLVGYTNGASNFTTWNRTSPVFSAPSTASHTYTTSNSGTVTSLLVYECTGNTNPDVVVGTKSTTAGQGAFSIWQGASSITTFFGVYIWADYTYSQYEVYPASGSIPGGTLGEVSAMALGDIDRDGRRDLVVATSTSSTTGAVMVFKYDPATTNRFTWKATISLASDAAKGVAVADMDGDGYNDIVVGTQTSTTTGRLLVYRNTYAASSWTFSSSQSFSVPGAVTSLAAGDVGGSSAADIVVGYCTSTVTNAGGARVYYNEDGAISSTPVDPTSGALAYMVTGIAIADFQYGTYPSTPSASRLDMALGYKQTTTAGGVKVVLQ
jgi:prepilin-type N-terminal cleavage/methylation domain-containing protein